MKSTARVQQVIAAFRSLGTADQETVLRKLGLLRRSPTDDGPADIERAIAAGVDWMVEMAAGPRERNIGEPWRPLSKDKVVEPGRATSDPAQVRNHPEK